MVSHINYILLTISAYLLPMHKRAHYTVFAQRIIIFRSRNIEIIFPRKLKEEKETILGAIHNSVNFGRRL